MKNKVKIAKRLLSILLVFLFSINSIAASVSDNDGSAFITKAEFDALKSSFQAQLDTYNTNIDSKIDEAIASYLSGITLANVISVENLLEKYQVSGCTGGIAWNKSDTFTSNNNEKQKIAWNVTLFGAGSNGEAGNKYASYKNYTRETWEKRMLAKNNEILSFQNWEPRLTGSGIGVDFYFQNVNTNVWIYDHTNTFKFYDNLNLTKENRKNTQTVAGGFQDTTFYESTMYSVTYAEFTKEITDPYVISPNSTANEYIVDSEEDFTLYDTLTQIDIEASADFTKGARINCSGVAGWALPMKGSATGTTGYRMAAQVGLKAVKRNTLLTKDLVDQCSGNGVMSSGLVLCIPKKKGKLRGQVKGSGTGKVLLWQGDKTSTYSLSTKKTNFSINTTYQDFEFDNLDEEKYVRVIFEPDSNTQSLEFKDLMLEISR